MGTKQRIGNEVTDRAGVQVMLCSHFSFSRSLFPVPRSPFAVPRSPLLHLVASSLCRHVGELRDEPNGCSFSLPMQIVEHN